MTDIILAGKMVMFFVVLLSLLYSFAHYIFILFPESWREISIDNGSMSVVTQDGSTFLVHTENSTVVTSYFAILCVKQGKRRMPVNQIIFSDMLEEENYRDFCTYLKHN